MQKIGLIIGLILTIIGMYNIDKFIIPTLDYFGKYVFFTAINIFVFWVLWSFYKKFNGNLKIIMPIVWGVVILLIGVKFA
jgi:ABC-type lipoprotein release transport system permease subunit